MAAAENRVGRCGRPRGVVLGQALVVVMLAAFLGGACGRNGDRDADALTGPYYAPEGIAIGGYDPVAYFSEQRPVKGDPAFAAQHEGVSFWFVSRENRERFVASPQQYAPQYGGYCAYGMSEGYRATTEPDAFTVHGGRLYLNYNREVRDLWTQDRDARIVRADENWRKGVR